MRSGLTRVLNPKSTGGLADSEITLAQALKPAGYATACVGKWHLGWQKQYLPLHHGFDRYFGLPYSNDMSPKTNPGPNYRAMPLTPLIRGDEVIEEEPDQAQLTRRYSEEAIRFIRDSKRDAKPFFLYLPYTFPHVPLSASDRFRGKSARGLYGDVVEELDWGVGEVLNTLKQEGLDANTLVFFSSDNGPWLIQRENGGSAGLLREGKTTTWEGGVREPFIARWPGKIPAGVVTQAFASLMDVFPTCLKLAGLKMPEDRVYDGVDLAPVLFKNGPGREAIMYFYNAEDLRAIRKGTWKLHIATNGSFPAQPVRRHDPPLLYNIERDPSEKYDVADSNPAIVKELLSAIEEHKSSMQPGPPQR
jgi:arylsulfatase A-like enzyme